MNRRERRKMEKTLGLDNYKRKLSREKRFELMSNNIIEGKKREDAMAENRRVQEQKEEDDRISRLISSRAIELMVTEKLDYFSATEKAKSEIKTN